MAILALAGAQGTYTIDEVHSSTQFSVKHIMISKVKGEFTEVAAALAYDPKNPAASRINATIDVNSINTRI